MQKHHPSIFFVGAFLSHIKGTKGPSETIYDEFKKKGWKLYRSSRFKNKVFRVIDIITSLFFKSQRFQIVHIDVFSGNALGIAIVAIFISNFLKKKIVITLHGGKLLDDYSGLERYYHYMFRKANLILTPSKFLQKGFLEKGFISTYMPNPIDLSIFQPSHKVKTTDEVFNILWVRAFTHNYNPHIAVKALRRVRDKGLNAKLTMVGPDMGLLESTKAEIDSLGLLSFVKILGPVDNNKLCKIYQSHDCYINTTSFESFGVSMMEAASCGIPICSNRVGEIPCLWEDNIEYLGNDKNDFLQLADNILRLAEDEELIKLLRFNALNKVQLFNKVKIIQDWEEIVRGVC